MSGMNINDEIGGYSFGRIVDTPFQVAEVIIQTGPLIAKNVRKEGVQPGTDTFDYWWSRRMTGLLQDNLIWMANLGATYVLGRYPEPNDSYLKRLAEWSAKSEARYIAVGMLYPMVSLITGIGAVFPDNRFGRKWREWIGTPGQLRIRGV